MSGIYIWTGSLNTKAGGELPLPISRFDRASGFRASAGRKSGKSHDGVSGSRVYWIAEPGDERICTAKPGDKLPYEKKVKCQWLFLEGLSQNPMDVVIAADKGQSHGCIGNYTMFHFEGDGLHLKT